MESFFGTFTNTFIYYKLPFYYMSNQHDKISDKVLNIIKKADEPLETREIEHSLKDVSRTKVLYRLMMLRGEGEVRGKQIGSGKGTWVWWA